MDYFFSRNLNGYIYTVDMFRIKTLVSRLEADEIRKFLNMRQYKHWFGYGYDKFADNWSIDKLWVGLGTKSKPNRDNALDLNDELIFAIEFNPNHLTDESIFIYNYFVNHYNFFVSRFDLAVDIPLNINKIVFCDIFKKSYSLFYNDFDNKTYYIGKGDGHIKIYNKKIESDLDYELTRFEVTKEVNFELQGQVPYIDFKFPFLASQPYYSDLSDDDTLDAILYAVNNGFPYRNLSRRYKDYIKKDLVGLTDLNCDCANLVLCKFIELVASGISNKPDKL